ncbi:MAG TPA: glycoside hydrolase family 36 N-terminal domain-containing protein, partial [Arachnia sp.]|nr:glycoside hydrolase family 36 N-terminal domain-containing protein [Arachnia sp.]
MTDLAPANPVLTTAALPAQLHLRAGGTSVVIDCPASSPAEVLYWGADLGPLAPEALAVWADARVGVVSGCADVAPRLPLVPTQADGWLGTPGLVGSRAGLGQFSAFRPVAVEVLATDGTDGAPTEVRIAAHDDEADLDLTIELRLAASGLLRARAELANRGEDGYAVDSLLLALPVPAAETQVVDQSGHHLRERAIAFHEFTIGAHEQAVRVARGHAASVVHGTCAPGTGWNRGLVHYVHVAWSGNTRTVAERNVVGQNALIGGELLLPGEVVLARGESYATPWLYATWGEGLDDASARVHEYLRARPHHPTTPRPVTFNAWEAVYFDHSLDR